MAKKSLKCSEKWKRKTTEHTAPADEDYVVRLKVQELLLGRGKVRTSNHGLKMHNVKMCNFSWISQNKSVQIL